MPRKYQDSDQFSMYLSDPPILKSGPFSIRQTQSTMVIVDKIGRTVCSLSKATRYFPYGEDEKILAKRKAKADAQDKEKFEVVRWLLNAVNIHGGYQRDARHNAQL